MGVSVAWRTVESCQLSEASLNAFLRVPEKICALDGNIKALSTTTITRL